MPSPRKRIGFLPTEEVQNIIERICKENKLSHSKVTSILVEEALRARGALENISTYENNDFTKSPNITAGNYELLKNDAKNKNKFSDLYQNNLNYDLEMIQEFMEFKLFKKIMYKNKNLIN